jgi:hypothetical protein
MGGLLGLKTGVYKVSTGVLDQEGFQHQFRKRMSQSGEKQGMTSPT